MLCCLQFNGSQDPQATLISRERRRISDEIEKELKAEEKRRQREHRILLLGCGEAGKSTFIKQMRIIHSDGFTTEERLNIKSDIACNIISAIQTLLQNTRGQWSDEKLEEDARIVEALPTRMSPIELLEYVDSINRLWQTDEVQLAYENRNRFQLVDCAKYFLTRVESVLKIDYLPDNQDIVQTRFKTTGIIEHDFEIAFQGKNKRKLILIDVGGQRSERRKWIHCFQDVRLILFLTAISEYDQVLAEDEATNRLQESLILFKTILNYHWFVNTSVVLFLNKVDILEEKIKRSSVRDHFPDFQGAENDSQAVIDFFTGRFSSLNPNPDERNLYIHPTCATDTENIKIVDVIVQEVILQDILKHSLLN